MVHSNGALRIYLQTSPTAEGSPRFCQLFLQPDLLGGWTLIRESGTQGSSSRLRREHHETIDEAEEALMRERDRLTTRGYQVVFVQGIERP